MGERDGTLDPVLSFIKRLDWLNKATLVVVVAAAAAGNSIDVIS